MPVIYLFSKYTLEKVNVRLIILVKLHLYAVSKCVTVCKNL